MRFALYASEASMPRGHPSKEDSCLLSDSSHDAHQVLLDFFLEFVSHFSPGCHCGGQFIHEAEEEDGAVEIDTMLRMRFGPAPSADLISKELCAKLRSVCFQKPISDEEEKMWLETNSSIDAAILKVIHDCGMTINSMGFIRNHHLQKLGIRPNSERRKIMRAIHSAIKIRRPRTDEDLLYRTILERVSKYDVVGLAWEIMSIR